MRSRFEGVVFFFTVLVLAGAPATLHASVGCGECSDQAPPNGIAICGCPTTGPGQIGIAAATGMQGQQVDVAIEVHTNTPVASFLIDVEYPGNLLEWVSTTRGPLAEPLDFFDGTGHPTNPLARVVADEFGPDFIAPGTTGVVAVMHFNVIGEGTGAFCFGGVGAGLSGYAACVTGAVDAPVSLESDLAPLTVRRLSPNPFRESTSLSYVVAGANAPHVNVTVYNVLGKRVRELVDRVQNAGSHEVAWDGRNDAGTPVRPGIYFYRIAAGPNLYTASVTHIR